MRARKPPVAVFVIEPRRRGFGLDLRGVSFLSGDEALAERLAKYVGPDLSAFVYTEHQKELAGRDGVEFFSSVFGETAGSVVVLYRETYGETRWSGIEKDAITSRRIDSGFNSIFMISLDGTAPAWIPSSRLWFGLANFGELKAAEAIREILISIRGNPREESFADRAVEVERAGTATRNC